jgi:hypothetical protein
MIVIMRHSVANLLQVIVIMLHLIVIMLQVIVIMLQLIANMLLVIVIMLHFVADMLRLIAVIGIRDIYSLVIGICFGFRISNFGFLILARTSRNQKEAPSVNKNKFEAREKIRGQARDRIPDFSHAETQRTRRRNRPLRLRVSA